MPSGDKSKDKDKSKDNKDKSKDKSNDKSCKKYNGFYPSFTPILNSLSVTTSVAGSYSLVYVNGSNFLPNGSTFINFGTWTNLPVTYYSSFNLSFVILKSIVSL